MGESIRFFISVWIKLFFVLTPFFVLTMFLSMTKGMSENRRRVISLRVLGAVIVISFALFFFGRPMFNVFGITLDSFRVGAGVLLFLSALSLVRGPETPATTDAEGDIAVVPLAIPITVGPATTGALLVMGAELQGAWPKVLGCAGLLMALICIGVMLFLAASVERIIGKRGITILSKLTGLILSALAAQMIFTGARNLININ